MLLAMNGFVGVQFVVVQLAAVQFVVYPYSHQVQLVVVPPSYLMVRARAYTQVTRTVDDFVPNPIG